MASAATLKQPGSVLTDVARIRSAKTPSPDDIANVGAGLQQQIYALNRTIGELRAQIASASGGGTAVIPFVFYAVPVVGGTATPDASKGTNLLVLTAAICLTDSNGNLYVNVAPPVGYSVGSNAYTNWQLISQEGVEVAWSSATAYVVGAHVSFNNVNYVSILNGTNQQPDTSPTYWTALAGYSTVFDASYVIGFAVSSPASPLATQCTIDFQTNSAGITRPTSSLIDQPISQ